MAARCFRWSAFSALYTVDIYCEMEVAADGQRFGGRIGCSAWRGQESVGGLEEGMEGPEGDVYHRHQGRMGAASSRGDKR